MSDQTMRDVSQRNPLDPENVFGRVFRRGLDVAADGGEHAAGARPSEDTVSSGGEQATDTEHEEQRPPSEQKMKHVDQTPPQEAGVNSVWERGGESTLVEDEE